MKRTIIILALVALLFIVGGVLAMSSANYRLDWFTPLTGGGGGSADSGHYVANFTVGQSAIGGSVSPAYQSCLGYWCSKPSNRTFLPILIRN